MTARHITFMMRAGSRLAGKNAVRISWLFALFLSCGVGVWSAYAQDNLPDESDDAEQEEPWDAPSEANRLDFYRHYLRGLDDGAEAANAVRRYISMPPGSFGSWDDPESGSERDNLLRDSGYAQMVSVSEMADLTRVATLVSRHGEALAALQDEGTATLMIVVAERLLDGGSLDGKDAATAAQLLDAAGRAGSAMAQSRLAFMYRHGLGVERDAERARQLAAEAAERGEAFALYQLARAAEDEGTPAGTEAATAYYRRFMSSPEHFRGSEGSTPSAILVANRLLSPGPALSSQNAQAAIAGVAEEAPDFARALAQVNLCTDCGGIIDLADAAEWLRLAHDLGDADSGYHLYRLLQARPELAIEPGEASSRLAANINPSGTSKVPFGYHAHTNSYLALEMERLRAEAGETGLQQKIGALLDRLCKTVADRCEESALAMASGGIDLLAVVPGINKLIERDSIYLVDTLAAYGDFAGALERGRRISPGSYSMSEALTPDNRAATFRRIVASREAGNMDRLPDGFVPLLQFLADNGDTDATAMLRLLEEPRERTDDIAAAPPMPQEEFDRIAAKGGLSRSFVLAARDRSRTLLADGRQADALRMELTALSAELQMNDIAGLSEGPLQRDLTRVCLLSKASERISGLGADDVAIVLAKDAVNTLQSVRASLSGVPERLQACFSDLVADQYRWLADFFVKRGRLAEAEFVMALLKDFEAFQFVGRDPDFRGRAYETLPFSIPEDSLKTVLDTLRPPTVPDARRSEELRIKRAQGGLTAEEERELDALDARLAEADAAYDAALDAILAQAEEMGRQDRISELENLGSLQGYLRREDGEPVALHYVVLDDRMHIILTTGYDRKSVTVTEWHGEPFSEARLDADIARFHAYLATPGSDLVPQARRLYDLLLEPFAADLEAAQTALLLVSSDRRLRYVPFAALHDGNGYVAERFGIAMLSDAGYEIAGDRVSGAPVAALGMTRQVEGFSALPGVRIEIDGIIKGDDGFGLFEGRSLLDADFSDAAFQDALRIGAGSNAGLGVVHVSSHFNLGDSDATSFLLLGTGERLNLRDIKRNRRAYEFGYVDLLTLSACETGYADPAQDGREIESLSKLTGSRGAHAILASLWPVSDNSTAVMMQRFYELRELGGLSKASALALTQREFIDGKIGSQDNLQVESIVLETAARGAVTLVAPAGRTLSLSHPYYWAPFVLTGNWR